MRIIPVVVSCILVVCRHFSSGFQLFRSSKPNSFTFVAESNKCGEPSTFREKISAKVSKGINFVTAGVAIASVGANAAKAISSPPPKISLKPLPYDYKALAPHISEKTLFYHHDKHHAKYVETTLKIISGTDLEDKDLVTIMKKSHGSNQGLFNNAAQAWNHEFYWNCMKPNGGGAPKPGSKIATMINKAFGSYDEFKKQVDDPGVMSVYCFRFIVPPVKLLLLSHLLCLLVIITFPVT
jgi:Iron/manganese superoxide dismutases, alpha-hairpin domain